MSDRPRHRRLPGWAVLAFAVLAPAACVLAQDAAREPAAPTATPQTVPAEEPPVTTPPAGWPESWRRAVPDDARLRENGWFAARVQKHRPALPETIQTVYVIPIRKEITPSLYDAMARKAIRARNAGAQLIVFDMHTPGGRLDAISDIANLIQNDLADTFTVVYVNRHAFSGGAIVSLACDEITMAPDGVIGDAMPITVGPQGITEMPPAVRVKMESAARALARSIAEQNGYNLDIVDAMITISAQVWLVRNRETGQLKVMDPTDTGWRGLVQGAPDTDVAAAGATGNEPWEFLKVVDGPNELATFTASEAYTAGLVDLRFDRMKDLMAHYHVTGKPVVLADTWSDTLVAWLTSPVIVGLLIFIGIVALYTELHSPGIGLPGAVAVVCFLLAFGAPLLGGLSQWWEPLLIVAGFVLILVEIFVIPGFGLAGILGGLFVIAGIVAVLVPQAPGHWPIPTSALAWHWFANGLLAIALAFVVSLAVMPLLGKVLPHTPCASKLLSVPARAATDEPVNEDSPILHVREGDRGEVHSMLRPVGKVRLGDNILDAMSEGAIIPRGTPVRVLRREGNRLVVERADRGA